MPICPVRLAQQGAAEARVEQPPSRRCAPTWRRGLRFLSRKVRNNLARAVGTAPDQPQGTEEHLRRFGAFTRHRDLGYVMALLSGIWNEMEQGRWEHAHAQLAMTMVSVEQTTIDNR